MNTRLVLFTLLAGTLGAGSARAQGPKPSLAAPTGSMESLPARVLRALQAPVHAAAEPCGVPACAEGDQTCRQRVFREVVGCLADGRLRALPDCPDCRLPGAPTQLFRAHGGGVTLYGTFAPIGGAGGHKALLMALRGVVEDDATTGGR